MLSSTGLAFRTVGGFVDDPETKSAVLMESFVIAEDRVSPRLEFGDKFGEPIGVNRRVDERSRGAGAAGGVPVGAVLGGEVAGQVACRCSCERVQ